MESLSNAQKLWRTEDGRLVLVGGGCIYLNNASHMLCVLRAHRMIRYFIYLF